MIEKHGNLFDSDANYLGHGVNCRGLMGAGIAKMFKSHYPRNFDIYRNKCFSGELAPGGFLVVPELDPDANTNMRLIVNFASQNLPGPDASYEWLFDSLRAWARQASQENRLRLYGGRIAIPEIGCGIGGLEWPIVQMHLEVIESMHSGIEFEVWHYEKKDN